MSSEYLTRRELLKLAGAIPAGYFAEKIFTPLAINLDATVEEVTGHPAGNAYFRSQVEEACRGSVSEEECQNNIEISPYGKVVIGIVNPIVEELAYRTAPSYLLSQTDPDRKNWFKDIIVGTEGIGLSKREIAAGIISSVFFGLSHNLTGRGFDAKSIPASSTFYGGIFWYLQRKLGFIANTAAHLFVNRRVFR